MKNEISPALSEPEVSTYERAELLVGTSFVVTGLSGFDSSRRIKADFGNVDARRVLRRLLNG